MTSEEVEQSSPEPKKKDVKVVLVKPEDTSDEALREAAEKIFKAFQDARAEQDKAEKGLEAFGTAGARWRNSEQRRTHLTDCGHNQIEGLSG